jgi:hypothetical protein
MAIVDDRSPDCWRYRASRRPAPARCGSWSSPPSTSTSTCTRHCTPGATGFLHKGHSPADLIAVVSVTTGGRRWLPQAARQCLHRRPSHRGGRRTTACLVVVWSPEGSGPGPFQDRASPRVVSPATGDAIGEVRGSEREAEWLDVDGRESGIHSLPRRTMLYLTLLSPILAFPALLFMTGSNGGPWRVSVDLHPSRG